MQDGELIELIKQNPNEGLSILMNDYMGLICTIVREKLAQVCDEFEMFVDFYNSNDKFS